MRPSREQNETVGDFLSRTDLLASKLRMTLRDVGPFIGLSKATFFAYRSGAREISHKAWAKLEEAERKSCLSESDRNQAISSEIKTRIEAGHLAAAKDAEDDDLIEMIGGWWDNYKSIKSNGSKLVHLHVLIDLISELKSRLESNRRPK